MLAAALCVLAAVTWSCAPDSGLKSASDYDVVITTYSPDADYGTIRSYAMPDSVAHVVDPDNPPQEVTRDFDGLILATVEEQLQLLGYQREPDPENNAPDIFVPVTVTASTHYGICYDWYPVWGWYPSWPGWGPGYGTWYPVPNTYTYSTGTIFIDMWDVKNADDGEQTVPVIWNAAINGLVGDTTQGTAQRIESSIEQAFEQSPYLGASR